MSSESAEDSIDLATETTVTEMGHSTEGSTSSEEEQVTANKLSKVKITKEFQENVIKYVKLDDLLKIKQEEMAALKEQIKPCEQYLLTALSALNEESIGITNGSLIKKKVETKKSLSGEIIKNSLLEKIKDINVVEDIMKTMESKRETTTRTDLKRTKIQTRNTKTKKKKNKKN